jgi:hypothetical protein
MGSSRCHELGNNRAEATATPTGINNQLKISHRVLLIWATINWQQMLENTIPTCHSITVGHHLTSSIVNEVK